jgi:plastocyanin
MDHSGVTSSATGAKLVEVVMKDNSFSPDHLSVKKGETVTFRFTNSGAQLHEGVIGNADAQAQAEMAIQHGWPLGNGHDGHRGGQAGDDRRAHRDL